MEFAWHIHHGVLIERLAGSIKTRLAYIKANKPQEEQELRQRLLKKVKGQLPLQFIQAWKTLDQAWRAFDQAWDALEQARETYKGEIEALHRQECPNCPWGGKTIFPKQ